MYAYFEKYCFLSGNKNTPFNSLPSAATLGCEMFWSSFNVSKCCMKYQANKEHGRNETKKLSSPVTAHWL